MEHARLILEHIVQNIEKTIVGKHEAIELVVAALACGGHVLLEDIPGVGKTRLASALAASVDCDFRRIQFTPDILPSDITGFSVFNPKEGVFTFRPGPVISHFVLADEINRASPKTQASLLEIMEENQVTVDSQTYALPQPFMVLATQNPVEYVGTYPLPEAQIDRFIIRLSLGYPSAEEETRILLEDKGPQNLPAPVATADDILRAREAVRQVRVEDSLARYIVAIADATRQDPGLEMGVSPRGSLALMHLARAYALMHGRNYVAPDDVRTLAPHTLCHRLRLSGAAHLDGKNENDVLKEILETVPAPPVAPA